MSAMTATTKTKTVKKAQDRLCAICGKDGIRAVEKIERVGKAERMCATHEDGTSHTWLEYESIADMGIGPEAEKEEAESKRLYTPKDKRLVECPRCHKPGYEYSSKNRPYIQHSNEPPIQHSNEPPISRFFSERLNRYKPYRYRRCILSKKVERSKPTSKKYRPQEGIGVKNTRPYTPTKAIKPKKGKLSFQGIEI